MPSREDELDAFKRAINLSEYAATVYGFVLDRRESSRNSAIMRHPSGEKIVITRDSDGHWIYFTIGDDGRDSGTIVDFVQHRAGLNIGKLRMELRPWLGRGSLPHLRPSPAAFAADLIPVTRDRQKVIAAWSCASVVRLLPYLAGRGIGEDLHNDPLFADRIRTDQHRAALFPHFDEEGLCGFEIKNHGFTGSSPGGEKGLWCSHTAESDLLLIVAESAIDAISHYALHKPARARYVSTGGSWSPKTEKLLLRASQRLPALGEIVLAFDQDPTGREYLDTARTLLQPLGYPIRVEMPSLEGTDWNDALKARALPHQASPDHER